MSLQPILHALVLHLYQPPGNLKHLLDTGPSELARILKCYNRILHHARKYDSVARLHLVCSVPLLEQLTDPELVNRVGHLEPIASLIDELRQAENIEFIASGYSHAPLPLIPQADWESQLLQEQASLQGILGRTPEGYYPPGGLFQPDMVPVLKKVGYRYVLLPRGSLRTSDGHGVDPYLCHELAHGGESIMVVAIDDHFSGAQEHLMEAPWFADEANRLLAHRASREQPCLITTCSDGENGEWFRRLDEENGYFGRFFSPYMEFCETGEFPVRPAKLSELIAELRPEPVMVHEHSDSFRLWDTAALTLLRKVTNLYWRRIKTDEPPSAQVRTLISRAEGSCYVLDPATGHDRMMEMLGEAQSMLAPQQPATPVGLDDRATASDVAVEVSAAHPPVLAAPIVATPVVATPVVEAPVVEIPPVEATASNPTAQHPVIERTASADDTRAPIVEPAATPVEFSAPEVETAAGAEQTSTSVVESAAEAKEVSTPAIDTPPAAEEASAPATDSAATPVETRSETPGRRKLARKQEAARGSAKVTDRRVASGAKVTDKAARSGVKPGTGSATNPAARPGKKAAPSGTGTPSRKNAPNPAAARIRGASGGTESNAARTTEATSATAGGTAKSSTANRKMAPAREATAQSVNNASAERDTKGAKAVPRKPVEVGLASKSAAALGKTKGKAGNDTASPGPERVKPGRKKQGNTSDRDDKR